MRNFQRNIFIIFVIAIVLGGIYYFASNPTKAPVSTVVQPAPDLVITNVREGQYGADYVVTIKNIGSKAVTKFFYICSWEYDRSPAANVCNNGGIANYNDRTMTPGTLEVGDTLEVTFSINPVMPGQELYFEADKSDDPATNNSIAELEETNNSYTFVKK